MLWGSSDSAAAFNGSSAAVIVVFCGLGSCHVCPEQIQCCIDWWADHEQRGTGPSEDTWSRTMSSLDAVPQPLLYHAIGSPEAPMLAPAPLAVTGRTPHMAASVCMQRRADFMLG
jgi:hypothetical protein